MIRVNTQLEKISEAVTATKNKAFNRDDYEEPLLSAIYQTENIALHLRKVANDCFGEKNPLLYERMYDALAHDCYHFSIAIQSGDIIRITLPCLLPRYKDNHKNIITEPLSHFLREYQKGAKLPQYKSVVMVVINHVSGTTTQDKIRDNDNYEYKQLVNTLAFWFLPDDDYQSCKMFNASIISETDYTEVFLVPQEKFADWFAKTGIKIMC